MRMGATLLNFIMQPIKMQSHSAEKGFSKIGHKKNKAKQIPIKLKSIKVFTERFLCVKIEKNIFWLGLCGIVQPQIDFIFLVLRNAKITTCHSEGIMVVNIHNDDR